MTVNSASEVQDGITLHFVVNTPLLIAHTIANHERDRFSSEEHQEDINAFQEYAWNISYTCSLFLDGRMDSETFFAIQHPDTLAAFFVTCERSREFSVIRKQTEAFLRYVQQQWNANYAVTSAVIQKLTGFDLQKELTVLITHPSLKHGLHLGNNTIVWGHHEDWTHYATVYLWHEILHSYFYNGPFAFSDHDDLDHALIELLSDEELRVQFHPEITYPPFEGYGGLTLIKEKILPYWRIYLEKIAHGKQGDILAFREMLIHELPELLEMKEE